MPSKVYTYLTHRTYLSHRILQLEELLHISVKELPLSEKTKQELLRRKTDTLSALISHFDFHSDDDYKKFVAFFPNKLLVEAGYLVIKMGFDHWNHGFYLSDLFARRESGLNSKERKELCKAMNKIDSYVEKQFSF